MKLLVVVAFVWTCWEIGLPDWISDYGCNYESPVVLISIMEISCLPALNALLNATAFFLLVSGWVCIRSGNKVLHGWFMGGAFLVSMIFLISYLTYHFISGHRAFQGMGWIRPVYYLILITHIILAMGVVPLALAALWYAVRRRWERHVKITRILFPVWIYVSVTGVVIYLFLYRLSFS